MTVDDITALLTNKFAGVRKDGLAHIARLIALQATTQEEAQALIDKMDADKVTETVREYRKNVDKEVTDATKTHEANLKKKFEFKEKGGQPDESGNPGNTKPDDPSDVASIIKAAVAEAVKPLQEKLAGFEGEQVTKTRLQTLEGKLKDMPENFKAKVMKDFKRMNFEDDESFSEYLTETESDIAAFNQELADRGLGQQPKPLMGKAAKEGADLGKTIAEKRNSNSSEGIKGKEI